ncbi:hypothetical protein Btru_045857 [Bulinus truncatus]|nr:hypothetical protein Btru_045857 [Bulinus truncatus]
MLGWIYECWDLACILGLMGLSTILIVRIAQILAGISEIEEVHGGTQDGSANDVTDPAHLQANDDCKERVRASRSPVRPPTKKKSARRSLSLPSGGLSYGDVKILYKDGHFVTVGAPSAAEKLRKAVEDGGETDPHAETFHRRNLPSSLKEVNEDIYDQDGNMRAEILSLLEKGISDTKQLDYNRWDDSGGGGGGEISRRARAGVPIFLSLPRRRQKGHRPSSADEGQLLRGYSKSQQSLVGGYDMDNRVKADQGSGDGLDARINHEGSSLKRNKSFTEAMGSNLTLNDADRGGSSRDLDSAELCDSGFDDQRLSKDESSQKSKSKGPGFIQRMLKKRRGSTSEKSLTLVTSSKSQKEDLSSSSLSLASTSSTTPTSPNKRDSRDSSLTRKMSFRGIFKRKNSSDMSGKKSSTTPEEQDNSQLVTFLVGDDSGQRRALTNIGEAEFHHDDQLSIDETDSLSPTSSRSRSPKTPLSNSSSLSSLQHSVTAHEDNDRTPTADFGPAVHRRLRSSSGRARFAGTSRLSGDSFSEYDFSSQEFQNSDEVSTPRSYSPGVLDVSAEGERTLVPSPASPSDRLSPCIYQTLSSSPQGGRRRRSRDCGESQNSAARNSSSSSLGADKGEITSSNSNDSGIQNDVNVTSSTESMQAGVRLRKSKSPSPATERPKSDITVRWADLLEQVMDTGGVKYRKEAGKLRKRPRPKSDIEESLEDEGLVENGDSGEEEYAEEEEEEDELMEEDEMEEDEEDAVEEDVDEEYSDEGGCHSLESRRALLINANSLTSISISGDTARASPSAAMSAASSSSDVVSAAMAMNSGESLQSLVELRRSSRGDRDVLSAKLAKFRRERCSAGFILLRYSNRSCCQGPTLLNGGMVVVGRNVIGEYVGQYSDMIGEPVGQYRNVIGEYVGQYSDMIGESVGQYSDMIGESVGQYRNVIGESVGQYRNVIGESVGQYRNVIGESVGFRCCFLGLRHFAVTDHLVRMILRCGSYLLGLPHFAVTDHWVRMILRCGSYLLGLPHFAVTDHWVCMILRCGSYLLGLPHFAVTDHWVRMILRCGSYLLGLPHFAVTDHWVRMILRCGSYLLGLPHFAVTDHWVRMILRCGSYLLGLPHFAVTDHWVCMIPFCCFIST